uniref:Uncharacterized protein n=1 Tax=uncultured Desulfobacterium sp. TaxID=201089 RepID=E1YC81_9BACT|nr:unknown protein [uncultured Desulfobacterium sp.]
MFALNISILSYLNSKLFFQSKLSFNFFTKEGIDYIRLIGCTVCPECLDMFALGQLLLTILYKVLSSFLCKIFISQFLKEWQTLTHFSDRV